MFTCLSCFQEVGAIVLALQILLGTADICFFVVAVFLFFWFYVVSFSGLMCRVCTDLQGVLLLEALKLQSITSK